MFLRTKSDSMTTIERKLNDRPRLHFRYLPVMTDAGDDYCVIKMIPGKMKLKLTNTRLQT